LYVAGQAGPRLSEAPEDELAFLKKAFGSSWRPDLYLDNRRLTELATPVTLLGSPENALGRETLAAETPNVLMKKILDHLPVSLPPE